MKTAPIPHHMPLIQMYSKINSWVIGFHGCDLSVCNAVVNGGQLQPSINDYDWLGNGVYFWEKDPIRATEWAIDNSKRQNSNIKTPSVIGAIIDLGNCLDLMERYYIETLKIGYQLLSEYQKTNLPQNQNIGTNKDLLIRKLDCAVIEQIHENNRTDNHRMFDSVRGLFLEGEEVYPNAGFREKTHVQICVRNPNCIKGYFIPIPENAAYPKP